MPRPASFRFATSIFIIISLLCANLMFIQVIAGDDSSRRGSAFAQESASTEVAPEPVVTEPAPEPIATEPAPEPVSTEVAPEPVVTEPAPEPVVTEPAPEPVSTEVAPEPVVTEPAPEPIATEPASEPLEEEMSLLDAPLFGPMAEGEVVSCNFSITLTGPRTFSFDAVGTNIQSYDWQFGDGEAASGINVSHTYAADGLYPITLTCVAADGGDPLVLTGFADTGGTVVPIASFTLDNDTGIGSLSFTATSTSTGNNLALSWQLTDSSGTPIASGSNATFSYTLSAEGTYQLSLTASDTVSGVSSTASHGLRVYPKEPKCDFTPSQLQGEIPLVVSVIGTLDPESGDIDTWSWTFGDGGSESGQGPFDHTYTTEGTYTITLTCTNEAGSSMVGKQIYADQSSGSVQANFTYSIAQNDSGAVQVCFTNTSTGVITTSTWTFGDSPTPEVLSGIASTCHTYSVIGQDEFTVGLKVEGITSSITSTAARLVTVVARPEAHFTFSPTNRVWSEGPITFTDDSIGIVTDWLWNFGDGVTSNEQYPVHEYENPGTYTVQLTATGPGGSSVYTALVTVLRLEITCNFSAAPSTPPYPGQSVHYDSLIGNLKERSVTYHWYVGGTEVSSAQDLDQVWPGAGTYLLTLAAETLDGASCTHSESVTVAYAELGCSLSTSNPAPAPNGEVVTYTADITDDQGRPLSYQWYVNGAAQGGPTTNGTFTYSWTAETTAPDNISFTVTPTPGLSCSDAMNVNVVWPDLTCALNGNPNPNPLAAPETYSALVDGLAGRSTNYTWYVDGAVFASGPDVTSITLPWSASDEGSTHPVRFEMSTTSGEIMNCSVPDMNLQVHVPNLTCNVPGGDSDPLIDEPAVYTSSFNNVFGRTINGYNWTLTDNNTGTVIDTGSTPTFNHIFIENEVFPGGVPVGHTFTLSYVATALVPDQTCTPASLLITPVRPSEGFTCNDEGRTWDTANFAPASASSNYTYGIWIDNSNEQTLQYTWQLIPSGWTGTTRTLRTVTLTPTDTGLIQATFSGAELGPIGTYTLHVGVVNTGNGTTCSYDHALAVGALTVDYTYNDDIVGVGELICLDNSSFTSHGGPLTAGDAGYTWEWDLGTADNSLNTQTIPAWNPDISSPTCFSYNQAGEYSITLRGSGYGFSMTRTHVFKVFGLQSISISRSSQSFAPNTLAFSAVGVNIFPDSYRWTFYEDGNPNPLGTRVGQYPTFYFTHAGRYRAVVTGQGNLGETTAEMTFDLIAQTDILAAFTPSVYSGVAPLTVCFTDNSLGDGINYWEWTFGDGTSLVYGSSIGVPKPASICHTYTTAGQPYEVRLLVRNASLEANASNVIRTYNLLESQSAFSITPMGSGQYCFTAILPTSGPAVTIDSWDFGDGTTYTPAPPSDGKTICHTYQAAGNYVVRMRITRGSETGEVSRPLNATTGSVPAPDLEVTASCVSRHASFVIKNTGASMLVADEIRVTNNTTGEVVFSDSIKLAKDQSRTITLSDMDGPVTITALDHVLDVTVNSTCDYRPDITVGAACSAGQVTFTLYPDTTKTDPMISVQSYQVFDASNNEVQSGTFRITTDDPFVITVDNPYGTYRFFSTGTEAGTLEVSSQCNVKPELEVTTNTCSSANVSFTVTNTSDYDMVAPQDFTIMQGAANVTPGDLLQLDAHESITLTPTGTINPYASYVFTSSGYAEESLTSTHDCDNPGLSVTTNNCGLGVVEFSIVNNGPGNMLLPQSYSITKNGAPHLTNSFTLNAGAPPLVISIPTPTAADQYATYRLTSSDFAGTLNLTHDCAPNLSVSTNACGTAITFTVTNTGGPMVEDQSITVTQAGADVTGTILSGGVLSSTFNLLHNGTKTFELPAGSNPYLEYILTTSGAAGDRSRSHNCQAPNITVSSSCASPITFTVRNTGGTMFYPLNVSVRQDGTGPALSISAASFTLAAGASQTVTIQEVHDPYQSYTLFGTSSFLSPDVTYRHDACPLPNLSVASNGCAYPLGFTVTNTGGAMLLPQTLTIMQGGTSMPASLTSYTIPANSTQVITITGAHDPYAAYTFIGMGGFLGNVSAPHTACPHPDLSVTTTGCGSVISFTVTNSSAASSGNMLAPQSITVTQGGSSIAPTGSTFQLARGASRTFTVAAGSNPYVAYGFTSSGFAGMLSITHDACPAPAIDVTFTCGKDIIATIQNTGGAMIYPQNVSITQGSTAQPLSASTFTLGAGLSTSINVTNASGTPNPYLPYTFTASGGHLSTITRSRDCTDPAFTVSSSCAYPITFSVTNTGGEMFYPQTVSITQGGTPMSVSAADFMLAAGASAPISITGAHDPYAAYTFTGSGGSLPNTVYAPSACAHPNLVLSTNDCSTTDFTFTVTNTGGPMLIDQGFSVMRGAANITGSVTPNAPFQLAQNGTLTVTFDGSSDPYVPYVFNTTGYAGDVSETHDCDNPALSVETNACGSLITFTVRNSSAAGTGAMLLSQPVTVMQNTTTDVTAGLTSGGVIDSSFRLPVGGSKTFQVASGSDPYAIYQFTSAGLAGNLSLDHDCSDVSLMVETNTCGPDVTFTVTNHAGDMLIPQDFTVTQNGEDVTAGVTPDSDFQLPHDGQETFTVAADSDPYAVYEFSTAGYAGSAVTTHECESPALSVTTNTCAALVEFTVTNDAAAGDMLIPQDFTVTRAGTVDATPALHDFTLDAGESVTFSLDQQKNPYPAYLFKSAGFAGEMSLTHDCPEPRFVITSGCTGGVVFDMANVGADMLVSQPFTIAQNSTLTLTPSSAAVLLKSGQRMSFELPGADLYERFDLVTDQYGITGGGTHFCVPAGAPWRPEPVATAAPAAQPAGTGLGGGLSVDLLSLPPWNTVTVCGHSCPPWQTYHTNLTGDWEVFRLDGADPVSRTTDSVNLTHGEGPDISDMAPSRSPDGKWIVFTSNRDGNWEIYVAPTDGDASQIQRVTHNHHAIDADPIWGPANYVAFESTRDGNWELYIVDMATGLEYRVTDSPDSSDINPFWSPDGSRLVFQSDRDGGRWQLYELNLLTLAVKPLSDGLGEDVDPQYSFDSSQIAFRSYRDGSANSVIYVMNADGTNLHPISDPAGDATDHAWSPDDRLIAYQSNLDGDLDIYVYDVASGTTRQLTDNTIADYAPMWKCNSETLVFTSDITTNPDIFEAEALPIDARAIDLLQDADQMTFETADDIYPESMPPEENASREGRLPSLAGDAVLGLQTDFLRPDTAITRPDISLEASQVEPFRPITACPYSD